MTARHPGTILMAAGVVLVLLGILWRLGWLHWFGHLPGDFRVEREGMRVYLPITSMLLVSLAVNLCLFVARKVLGS